MMMAGSESMLGWWMICLGSWSIWGNWYSLWWSVSVGVVGRSVVIVAAVVVTATVVAMVTVVAALRTVIWAAVTSKGMRSVDTGTTFPLKQRMQLYNMLYKSSDRTIAYKLGQDEFVKKHAPCCHNVYTRRKSLWVNKDLTYCWAPYHGQIGFFYVPHVHFLHGTNHYNSLIQKMHSWI